MKKSPAPKVVQKYIERTLLLKVSEENRKFDLRQWVLVTSFDPLTVYVYGKAYLRLCGSEFDLREFADSYKHLTNYSIQKKGGGGDEELIMSSDEFMKVINEEKGSDLKWEHFIN